MHMHTHTLPNMHHSHSLPVKTWNLFTFPPGGNWQKKEQACLDRSDTSGAGTATQTTTCPARERRSCCTFSQKAWETSSEIWQRHRAPRVSISKNLGRRGLTVLSFKVCVCVSMTVWEKGRKQKVREGVRAGCVRVRLLYSMMWGHLSGHIKWTGHRSELSDTQIKKVKRWGGVQACHLFIVMPLSVILVFENPDEWGKDTHFNP